MPRKWRRTLASTESCRWTWAGTTAKICLIDDGTPQYSRAFEVDRSYRFKKGSGLPVRIPVIEMVEIGAGGGSIATVDRLGRIAVGPQSAGSEPGPACYGRGGDHATVTDADVILGRLDPARFAGGTMTLDTQAAAQALHRDVGAPWRGRDCPVGDAAGAVSEIVDENMAAAARAHAAEWGKDTANRTLIAFGGAAPIHAARIAEKLDLDAVLVPPAAGVGSAMGFLAAPVAFEVVRSRYVRLSTFDPALVDAVMADMRAEAHAVVDAIVAGQLTELRRAYMRYLGQGYEIAVDVPNEVTVEGMRVAFDRAYEQLYGRLIPGLDVEVLSWTLTLRGEEPGVASSRLDPSTAEDAMSGRILRNVLRAGDRIDGPSTIVEDQTTTIVPQGFVAHVDEVGNILVRRTV